MMTKRAAAAFACVLAAGLQSGCRSFEDSSSTEVARNVQEVEFKAKEIQTVSTLAKLEESLAAFVKTERRIPEKLSELVPKYLAEIPSVETGVSGHGESNRVRVYPSSLLRDGHVDGTRLRDTGGWGYVFNDRQVVVFVDCTHKAASGRAWYLERGSF